MPWFRMHHEARTDAKLRTLADDEFRVWFNLLCYAAEQDNRGRIECADDFLLAIEVAGGDESLMIRVLQKLARLRIICWDGDEDVPGDTLTFINFDNRNYDKPSDHPDRVSERVKRHRAKNETPVKRDVTRSNDPDTDTDKTRKEESREVLTSKGVQGESAADKPPPKQKRASRIPDDFALTDTRMNYALKKGLDSVETSREFEKFVAYWQGTGKPMVNWDATWQRWVLTAIERGSARASPNGTTKPIEPRIAPKAAYHLVHDGERT
jgi:hypothetical protein